MKFQRREKSKNPIDIYGVGTVDTGAMFKQYDNDNLLEIYLSEDILKNAGDMIAEILIVDVEGEQRLTSESFTFKIEPSLTPNMKNLNFEKAFEKGDDE